MSGHAIPLRAALLLLAAITAGCGTVPSGPGSGATPHDAPLAGGAAAFEQRQRDRALAQQREGRLGEAAVSWEILVALRPGSADYREKLAETRRQIDAAVPQRLQRAQQTWRRGELDTASSQFLGVLALQPDNAQAADALRSIERERNRILYLGKLSRITLTRSNGGALQAAKTAPASAPDRNDLEHAAMLRTQGELDAAIVLLERYVATRGPDPTACRMLDEMALQKAGAAGRTKPAGNAAGARAC